MPLRAGSGVAGGRRWGRCWGNENLKTFSPLCSVPSDSSLLAIPSLPLPLSHPMDLGSLTAGVFPPGLLILRQFPMSGLTYLTLTSVLLEGKWNDEGICAFSTITSC